MKTKAFTIVVLIVLVFVCRVEAALFWDIYSDTTIQVGEEHDHINIYNDAVVTMTGGMVDSVVTHDISKLIVSDGYIRKVDAWDSSIIEINGGVFNSTDPSSNSTINFSGNAQTSRVIVEGSGVLNMDGGTATLVGLWDSGTTNLSGGTITDYVFATHESTVNVLGYDLSISKTGGAYGHGQVSGFWNSGSPFVIDLENSETYDHINLIPEPSSLIFLAFGSLIIWRKT